MRLFISSIASEKCVLEILVLRRNVHRARAAAAGFSLVCYVIAFLFCTTMPKTRERMENKNTHELKPNLVVYFFLGGIGVWVGWIMFLKLLLVGLKYLEKRPHSFWAKFGLLMIGAPGLTLFPVLSAYLSTILNNEQGARIVVSLALSSFFLELMFVQDQDFGKIDMLQAVHLSAWSNVSKHLVAMFLVSCIYYGRKFVVFFVGEFIKWRHGRNEPQEQQDPKLRQSNLEHLEFLVGETETFIAMANDGGVIQVMTEAYNRGDISHATLLEFQDRFKDLSTRTDIVRAHLKQNGN